MAGWPVPFCMPSVRDVCCVTLLPEASRAMQHPLQPMLPIPQLPAMGCSEALLTSMLPHGASVERLELSHSAGKRQESKLLMSACQTWHARELSMFSPQVSSVLQVRLDGHDLGMYDHRWLKRRVGIVSQEPTLYGRRWVLSRSCPAPARAARL